VNRVRGEAYIRAGFKTKLEGGPLGRLWPVVYNRVRSGDERLIPARPTRPLVFPPHLRSTSGRPDAKVLNMPTDPFAVPSALRKLESLIEDLTHQLRDRREPLERAISDLLFVADLGYGPHELAVRLDAVGAAVRDAGLVAEVHRMNAARSAIPNPVGTEMSVALALLDAAVSKQTLADLLARLHEEHAELLPGVRTGFARAGEQLLAVWCELHATDLTSRFRAEVQRLDLDLHRIEQWHMDHKSRLTNSAALVLDRLLNGREFAVGRFDEVLDLEELDEVLDDGLDGSADGASGTVRADTKSAAKIPMAEAEVLVREYLLKHGVASTTRAVHAATGVSVGGVGGTAAWKAFQAEREKRRSGKLRTVSLTDEMLAVVPNSASDHEDEIAELIREQKDDADADDRQSRRERPRRS